MYEFYSLIEHEWNLRPQLMPSNSGVRTTQKVQMHAAVDGEADAITTACGYQVDLERDRPVRLAFNGATARPHKVESARRVK